MGNKDDSDSLDPEVAAMNVVVTALQDLDTSAQQRVISYAVLRFKLPFPILDSSSAARIQQPEQGTQGTAEQNDSNRLQAPDRNEEDGLEGINAVARRWMSRNELTSDGLSKLFSLGIDEIDLVAQKVPGGSKKQRMRSVILLKGVASYLGGGVARVAHDHVKEACLHYNAFDTDNFAKYLKKMSAEVGGTKEAGYTLTARGLSAATELVKAMIHAGPKKG